MQYSVLRDKFEDSKICKLGDGLSFFTHYLQNQDNEYSAYFEEYAVSFFKSNKIELGFRENFDLKSLKEILWDVPFKQDNDHTFTFVDMFCGIGGFRIAMQNMGGKCLFSCDIDQYARRTYEANFGEMPFGDITKIDLAIIPNHDVLCGGFPCQPFSISGHKKGYQDIRGRLIDNLVNIVKVKKPKVVLLENVKHFVFHDNGNTIKELKNKFDKIGYVISCNTLNASDFGVPQNRERLIIVAHRTNIFDFDKLNMRPKTYLNKFIDERGDFEYLLEDYTLINNPIKQKSGLLFVGHRNKPVRVNGARPNTEHLSRVHKQPNRIYSINGVAPTLSAMETSGRYWIYDGVKVRKLTLKECYRIMGFPDRFIMSLSKVQAYKQVGNSVCVPMLEDIIQEIVNQKMLY